MYFQTSYSRLPAKRIVKSTATYPVDLAWAAVAAADRVNGSKYVNDQTYFSPDETRLKTNKAIAYEFLDNPETLTDEDHTRGQELADHFKGLLFAALGKPLQGFLETVNKINTMENVGRFEVACMAALPRTYRTDCERKARDEQMMAWAVDSDYIGAEGSRQILNVRIVETFFSQKYMSLIVTAKRGKDIVKFFTTKPAELFVKNTDITVKGTVKRNSVNDRTGAKESWLNRVQVV